jgi:hypothetical protein
MRARATWWWLPLAAAGVAVVPAQEASANAGKAFKDGWNCAKSHVSGAGVLAKDIYLKGEQVAALSATAGKCLAASGADQQGFALVMAALTTIKIVAPESVPTGQCKPSVRNAVSRPFGAGIAAVLPSGGVKNQLKQLLESDAAGNLLWDKFTALPPPVSTYASHVDCACEFIDGGLSLADLSAVSSVVSNVSSTCATFLDSAGLGFINDLGGAALAKAGQVEAAVGNAWEDLKNDPKPAPDEAVYFGYWGANVPSMARVLVKSPGTPLATAKWQQGKGTWISLGPGCYQTQCLVDVQMQYKDCVAYYQSHRFSDDHAHSKCRDYHARAENEAAKLAREWRAIIDVRTEVEARVKAAVENDWVWRLPYLTNTAYPSKLPNRWTTPQAMSSAFPAVIGNVSLKEHQDPWLYQPTGIYQAAREILPNVSFDPARATELAVAAAAAGFRRDLEKRWDADATQVRAYWMDRWFPTPPGASQYGCPNQPLLAKACVVQLQASFDKVCLPAVRAHHLNSPNQLALGVRLKDAEENCRSWIAPQVSKAVAIGNYNLGPMNDQLCGALPDRSSDAERCLRRVSDAYLECAMDAIAANQGVAQVEACLADARQGIAVRTHGSTPVSRKPVTAPVDAPQPGSVPMQVPSPATVTPRSGSPQAPRTSAPVTSAPAPTVPTVPAPARAAPATQAPARQTTPAPSVPPPPAKLPTVAPPAGSGRPPAPPAVDAQGRPVCPAGQTPQTRRDGVVECVTRGG